MLSVYEYTAYRSLHWQNYFIILTLLKDAIALRMKYEFFANFAHKPVTEHESKSHCAQFGGIRIKNIVAEYKKYTFGRDGDL